MAGAPQATTPAKPLRQPLFRIAVIRSRGATNRVAATTIATRMNTLTTAMTRALSARTLSASDEMASRTAALIGTTSGDAHRIFGKMIATETDSTAGNHRILGRNKAGRSE